MQLIILLVVDNVVVYSSYYKSETAGLAELSKTTIASSFRNSYKILNCYWPDVKTEKVKETQSILSWHCQT